MSVFPDINFRAVQWKQTLTLHALRASCAGIVWMVVLLVFGAGQGGPWLTLPIMMPLAYIFAVPVYLAMTKLFLAILGDGIGQLTVGLMMLAFAVGIAVGDPLVYLLHKNKPELVPTREFRFLNLATVLFVLDPEKV